MRKTSVEVSSMVCYTTMFLPCVRADTQFTYVLIFTMQS